MASYSPGKQEAYYRQITKNAKHQIKVWYLVREFHLRFFQYNLQVAIVKTSLADVKRKSAPPNLPWLVSGSPASAVRAAAAARLLRVRS